MLKKEPVSSLKGTARDPAPARPAPAGPAQTGPLSAAVAAAFAVGAPGLTLVEQRILARLNSDAPQLTAIPQYLLKQGGKRIRPLLALLSHRLFKCEELTSEVIDVAAGIELIHMATLLHDDIIDEAPTRRHQRSAYREFGLAPSLLAGDFLLVRAFGLCAHLDQFIVKATERACVELTEGEVLEGVLSPDSPRSYEEYLNIVGKKTASLFALACESGAFLAGVAAPVVEQLRLFGLYSGIAFQMVDDILDIIADEDLLGKPAGTDLRQKTPSLVNIIWLQSGDPLAPAFFGQASISAEASKEIAGYLRNSEVVTACREYAREYATKANSLLSALPGPDVDGETRNQLCAIVEYTLDRCL